MAEYKKNHFVPKVILKHWVTKGPKYDGVHVYEFASKDFSFSSANGGSAFSFAIVNDLYVPVIEGERAVGAEKWLSGLEGAIGKILPTIIAGKEVNYPDLATATKFTMGLLSLEFRSEYALAQLRAVVQKDSETQSFLGVAEGRTVDQVIVENVVNLVDGQFRKLLPVKMRFLQTTASEFIVTDCPVVDERYVGERIVVVSPTLAIALSKGAQPFQYGYFPASSDLVDQINSALALHSRSWIAGKSESDVRKYSAVVGTDAWEKLKASEKVAAIPFDELSKGWEFKGKA